MLLTKALEGVEGDMDAVPRALFYEEPAAARLAEALRQDAAGKRVVVLCDARTREVGAAELLAALGDAGWQARELVVPDPPASQAGMEPSPICDDHTKEALEARLGEVDALVALGSGVINDLTKWIAASRAVPYAVLATAASMNGYAAANVAATVKGVKTLVAARAPRLVAARPSVIEAAPHRLTAAGLGDVLAKPVSTADWLVNHLLFAERFNPGVASLIDHLEPRYLDHPEALARGESEAVRALFEALVLSGCAMTLHGSSMPASGGEHLISHTLDMTSEIQGVPHDLHGRQVGVATIFAAALYQRLFSLNEPTFQSTAVPFDASVWGERAGEVAREHALKVESMKRAAERLAEPGRFVAVHQRLAPVLRRPEALKRCLRLAGAAHTLDDIGCSRERFLMAVEHCSSMRGRFTSVDLGRLGGVLPDEAGALVDAWLSSA
jgi:glycerol-1-phosphate dehydrogenase [NAD(P)+]